MRRPGSSAVPGQLYGLIFLWSCSAEVVYPRRPSIIRCTSVKLRVGDFLNEPPTVRVVKALLLEFQPTFSIYCRLHFAFW